MSISVAVIGGGAAGMMAASAAAENGAEVTLFEKNKRLGWKLSITGKGRCNITNDCDIKELIANIPGNGPFLYSAFARFSNRDTVELFHRLGVATKVERGGRVFPESDQAAEVVEALENHLREVHVYLHKGMPVKHLWVNDGVVQGVILEDGRRFYFDRVVVATGGASYPATGSTGDGFRMAEEAGHTIVPLRPSLVPLITAEPWVAELAGLSLRNIEVTATVKGRLVGSEFGEMLFTHFGVSGPVILTLSRAIVPYLPNNPVSLTIDLKPALGSDKLDNRLQRDFTTFSRKQFKNSLSELLPKSLIPVFVSLSGIPGDKEVHQITREERLRLVRLLKGFPLTVTDHRPLSEAVITAGGVSTKEIDPKTMASKKVKGLYFAGEVIDIDGFTGGYNLQAAWSTGFVAGTSAAL